MARDFDGTAGVLSDNTALLTSLPFTFACWCKPDTVTASGNLVFLGDKDHTARYAIIMISGADSTMRIGMRDGGLDTWGYAPTSPTVGEWQHAAGVFASSTSRTCYRNGAAGTASTESRSPVSYDRTSIGSLNRSNPANYFDGAIAEVGIWNIALSADEVSALAAGLSPQLVRPESLVGYWPLFGRAGASGGEPNWANGEVSSLSASGSPALADHPRIIYPHRRAAIMVPQVAGTAPTLSDLQAVSITASSVQGTYDYAF